MHRRYCSDITINICRRNSRNLESINSKQYCNVYLYIYAHRKYMRNNSSDHCNSYPAGNSDI